MAKEAPKRLFLTPAEAAIACGMSRSKMYELISSGAIRSVRFDGRMIRVPMQVIEELAAAPREISAER